MRKVKGARSRAPFFVWALVGASTRGLILLWEA